MVNRRTLRGLHYPGRYPRMARFSGGGVLVEWEDWEYSGRSEMAWGSMEYGWEME